MSDVLVKPLVSIVFFFFFQAEDGIRDYKVTGVQTCALPIAAGKPDILNVSTLAVLDNAARLGVLPHSEAEVLRQAARLYHDLTQILRLWVTGKFKSETAGEDLLRGMARAGGGPEFSGLVAR